MTQQAITEATQTVIKNRDMLKAQRDAKLISGRRFAKGMKGLSSQADVLGTQALNLGLRSPSAPGNVSTSAVKAMNLAKLKRLGYASLAGTAALGAVGGFGLSRLSSK